VLVNAEPQDVLPGLLCELRTAAILATADITGPTPLGVPAFSPTPSDLKQLDSSDLPMMSDLEVLRSLQPLLSPGADLTGASGRTPDMDPPARFAVDHSQEWYKILRPNKWVKGVMAHIPPDIPSRQFGHSAGGGCCLTVHCCGSPTCTALHCRMELSFPWDIR
jgi:hypothetical protein